VEKSGALGGWSRVKMSEVQQPFPAKKIKFVKIYANFSVEVIP
jgi:hypothetical protein